MATILHFCFRKFTPATRAPFFEGQGCRGLQRWKGSSAAGVVQTSASKVSTDVYYSPTALAMGSLPI